MIIIVWFGVAMTLGVVVSSVTNAVHAGTTPLDWLKWVGVVGGVIFMLGLIIAGAGRLYLLSQGYHPVSFW